MNRAKETATYQSAQVGQRERARCGVVGGAWRSRSVGLSPLSFRRPTSASAPVGLMSRVPSPLGAPQRVRAVFSPDDRFPFRFWSHTRLSRFPFPFRFEVPRSIHLGIHVDGAFVNRQGRRPEDESRLLHFYEYHLSVHGKLSMCLAFCSLDFLPCGCVRVEYVICVVYRTISMWIWIFLLEIRSGE